MECQTCNKPLGHDSLINGYQVCLEHRRCVICHFTVTSGEVSYCLDHSIEVRHYRCMVLTRDANGQSRIDLDLMNRVTLLISSPDQTEAIISNMTSFDQRYAFLQSVQAVAANLSILLRKDKASFEARLRQEQQEEKHAKQEHKGKKNPIKQAAAVGITTSSEKVARHKLSMREKSINAMMKFSGLSREEAEATQVIADAKRNPITNQ